MIVLFNSAKENLLIKLISTVSFHIIDCWKIMWLPYISNQTVLDQRASISIAEGMFQPRSRNPSPSTLEQFSHSGNFSLSHFPCHPILHVIPFSYQLKKKRSLILKESINPLSPRIRHSTQGRMSTGSGVSRISLLVSSMIRGKLFNLCNAQRSHL